VAGEPYLMRGPRTTVGTDGFRGLVFGWWGVFVRSSSLYLTGAGFLRAGWLGPGSALGSIAKRRVAPLEAAAREWRLVRQGEASVTQVFNVALFRCWVLECHCLPSGVVCLRGAGAQRGGWCVAPSLTLVLEPCGAGPAT
jgi:hypothetical protein